MMNSKQGVLYKQFRGWNKDTLLKPRPDQIGLPYLSNHKFMCATDEYKINELTRLGVKCNHCDEVINFSGKKIINKKWGFVEVECCSCNKLARVSCYSDDELRK